MLENRRIYPETNRTIESCVKKHEIEKRSFLDGFRWFVVLLLRANTHIMVSLLNSRPTSCQSLEGMTSNRFSFRLTNKRYYWWSRRFLLCSSKCPKVCSRQWLNLYYQFNVATIFGGKNYLQLRDDCLDFKETPTTEEKIFRAIVVNCSSKTFRKIHCFVWNKFSIHSHKVNIVKSHCEEKASDVKSAKQKNCVSTCAAFAFLIESKSKLIFFQE